eukprot:SM000024S07753  [mRNA]  locus=s24:238417:248992:- [translate_table: standard]
MAFFTISNPDFVASAGADGSVLVTPLFADGADDGQERFEFGVAVHAVALDPAYAVAPPSARRFVSGGDAGRLLLSTSTRGRWLGLGPRDTVLAAGREGPIRAAAWHGRAVAWATDAGVHVLDLALQQQTAFLPRPELAPPTTLLRPCLLWQGALVLVVGWGPILQRATVLRSLAPEDGLLQGLLGPLGLPPASLQQTKPKGNAEDGTLRSGIGAPKWRHRKRLLQAPPKLDCWVCGLAPYGGDALVILGTAASFQDAKVASLASVLRRQPAQGSRPPEARVVTWAGDELAVEELPLQGYQSCGPGDYLMAHTPLSDSSGKGGRWTAGDEPLYYMAAPQDVVLAKPRDAEDHVLWLLQHEHHAHALEAAEAANLSPQLLDEVRTKYLDHLLHEGKYEEAAELWVGASLGKVGVPLCEPSEAACIGTIHTHVVLKALLATQADHEAFLAAVKSWPVDSYDVEAIIFAAQQRLSLNPSSRFLKEALGEMYLQMKSYDQALDVFIELHLSRALDLVDTHRLYHRVHELVEIDEARAMAILVQNVEEFPPAAIVPQLLGSGDRAGRQLTYQYLHAMYEKEPMAAVELYAEFDKQTLLPFLRSSHHYPLDKAHSICVERGLVKEQVYVLGRMGNSHEALGLIIEQLHDMEQAIEFVTTQNDEDLWDELVSHAVLNSNMVGQLLEHAVGHIDPLEIVVRVPCGLHVSRLLHIIQDYGTEMSLRRGCNDILKADCVALLAKYSKEARHGVRVADEKSARCSICLDPLRLHNVPVMAFYCSHSYHLTCLAPQTPREDHGPVGASTGNKSRDLGGTAVDCHLCTKIVGSIQ